MSNCFVITPKAHRYRSLRLGARVFACALVPLFVSSLFGQSAGDLRIKVVQGNYAFNDLSTKTVQKIGVTVADASGNPVAGAAVLFQAPTTGPSVHFGEGKDREASAHADMAGFATSPFAQPDGGEGIFEITVLASAGGRTAHGVLTQSNVAAVPVSDKKLIVKIQSGDGLENKVKRGDNAGVPGAKVVVLVTLGGRPAAGANVKFTFPHIPTENGGADLDRGESGIVTTGADGLATIPSFHAKVPAGQFRISVSAEFGGQEATADVRQTNSLDK